MKTKLLILLFLFFLIPQTAFSLLAAQTPEELYDSHHTIIKGKILDYNAVSLRQTLYDVEVIEYLKNPQEDKIIQALGDGVSDARESISTDRIFHTNDIVLLYLYYIDDSFTISPYSKIVEDDFDKTLFVTGYDVTYEIPYSMDKGIITNAVLNCDEGSLFLFINSDDDGILKLDIPDNLFSSVFMVLIDGEETIDGVSIINEIITINYPKNTKNIEMIAVFALSPDKYDGVCDADTDYVSENKSLGITDEELCGVGNVLDDGICVPSGSRAEDFRDAEGEIIEVGNIIGEMRCDSSDFVLGFLFPELCPRDQFVVLVLVIVLPIAGIIVGSIIIWKKRK